MYYLRKKLKGQGKKMVYLCLALKHGRMLQACNKIFWNPARNIGIAFWLFFLLDCTHIIIVQGLFVCLFVLFIVCTHMYLAKRHQRCKNYTVNIDHILYSKNVLISYRDITRDTNDRVTSWVEFELSLSWVWVEFELSLS